MFNWVFNLWILFLNSVFNGLINLNCIFFGSLFILWWDLIVCVVFVLDLIMLVYNVFCVKKEMFFLLVSFVVLLLKIYMNLFLMILCFCFGLDIFFNLFKKWFFVLILMMFKLNFLFRFFIICFVLFLCSRLWLMKIDVNWLLIVFCKRILMILELMLFESLSKIFLLLICLWIFFICILIKLFIV